MRRQAIGVIDDDAIVGKTSSIAVGLRPTAFGRRRPPL